MAEPFKLLLRVRYAECDAQQVVFNARYGDYIDLAMTEFFRQMFGGYQQLLDEGLDNQVVSLSTQWHSPAKFDDVLAIAVQAKHVGNSSYILTIAFSDYVSGRAVASAEIVYVLVTTPDYQKTAVPEAMREKLLVGLPNVIVNQVGELPTVINSGLVA